MNFVVELLIKTMIGTVYLTGMVILAGLFLGILRTESIKNFQRSFGIKAVMITGFIGVPIHELSHAIVALLFGHKITAIKLLQRPNDNGTLGYVSHSYNPVSLYQQVGNFFIGVAPIFGGTFAIIALMRVLIPISYNEFISTVIKSLTITELNRTTIDGILISYGALIKSIFLLKNFTNPFFYLYIFLGICISTHISLSNEDIKGATRGIGIIFLILLVLNIFSLSKYIVASNIIKYNILIIGFLIVAIILSLITFFISLIFLLIKGLRGK
ncbi:MAG: hypothetical protein H7Y18_07945 [Clostridiaceae bacterium]|nr:hypothetical protein [Clostridiaceae bacterium]